MQNYHFNSRPPILLGILFTYPSRQICLGLKHISIGFICLGLLAQCKSPGNAAEEAVQGVTYQFQPGFPEMRMGAIGFYNEKGEPGIDVFVDVVYSSLVFKQDEQGDYSAQIQLNLNLINDTADPPRSYSQNSTFTIRHDDVKIVESQKVFQIGKRFPVIPGQYRILANLVDLASKKATPAQASAFLPSPESDTLNSTDVLVLAKVKDELGYTPIPTYDVPGLLDSLKFSFQLNKGIADTNVTVTTRLYRFQSDTTPARWITAFTPQSGIELQGIDYDDDEIVGESRRDLSRQFGQITFEYPFPNPGKGNYRFEMILETAGAETIRRARDFGIKTPNYPTLATPRELVAPLYYLMNEKSWIALMKIEDEDSLRRSFDSFWLKNVKNKNKAVSVIDLYYSRVEEVNKLFSTYKEGWKMDMGMIHVLFGRPWYVERNLDIVTWQYGNNPNDFQRIFQFKLVRGTGGKKHGFQVFQLQRRSYYNQVVQNKISDWLTGQILRGQL